jgi:BirA family biotin operon repressor/biotin-[acetyl-CoA-carboxylase] ligase
MTDKLKQERIQEQLTTEVLGRKLVYLERTDSTNNLARELARSGASEGTLVIAEEQSGGKGRLGRTWTAPPGCCLLMSLILRPQIRPDQCFRLTMLSATATTAAIEAMTGLRCGIKWPNDVWIGARKTVGILNEMSLHKGQIAFVVLGIGINVNADMRNLPEIASTATSLAMELDHEVDRTELLCRFLAEAEARYRPITESEGAMSGFEEWRSKLITLGQQVTVHEGQIITAGLAEDVDTDGALRVRQADGRVVRIAAGDVSLRPINP